MQIECCVGEVLMKDTLRFPLSDSRLTIELTRGRTAKAYRLDDLTKEDEGLFYCHKPDDTVCSKDRVQLIIRQKRVD